MLLLIVFWSDLSSIFDEFVFLSIGARCAGLATERSQVGNCEEKNTQFVRF